jgi:DNA-binding transcriptional regulator LsrR (DeoR family)
VTDPVAERPADPAPDHRPDATRLPVEFDDVVMWAAWLYYADQMTQSEIASRLNVSRATIVNYLAEARDRGIVSVTISPAANARTAAARALMARYGLDGAFVVPANDTLPLTQRLGAAGARVLADQIEDGDTIGVAWGRTVLSAAGQITLPAPRRDLTVVQVSGSSLGAPDFSPELCTSILSSRIGARCVNLLAPAILSSPELKAALLAEPVLQRQFELIHATDRILFGVGDIGPAATVRAAAIASDAEIADYIARGAKAVIIGRFIDAQGRALGGPHDDRQVGITLDELRKVRARICLGGGAGKIDAMQATLAAGYATHVVTDLPTAEALLAR